MEFFMELCYRKSLLPLKLLVQVLTWMANETVGRNTRRRPRLVPLIFLLPLSHISQSTRIWMSLSTAPIDVLQKVSQFFIINIQFHARLETVIWFSRTCYSLAPCAWMDFSQCINSCNRRHQVPSIPKILTHSQPSLRILIDGVSLPVPFVDTIHDVARQRNLIG